MADRIAIVGCGADKLAVPVIASALYTGPYFRACYRAAVVIAPGLVFILSAKHGLVDPDQVLVPYDLTLGEPGAITAAKLRVQARRRGMLDREVIVLAGHRYTALVRRVWPDAVAPLAGQPGIGAQLHVLKEIYDPAR